jgi:hypothetical protein
MRRTVVIHSSLDNADLEGWRCHVSQTPPVRATASGSRLPGNGSLAVLAGMEESRSPGSISLLETGLAQALSPQSTQSARNINIQAGKLRNRSAKDAWGA